MANLETLELTINANAGAATRGIGHLINSLSSLSSALTKPLADLQAFNAELVKLSKFKPVLGEMFPSANTSGIRKQTSAIQQQADAVKQLYKADGSRSQVDIQRDVANMQNLHDYISQRQAERSAKIGDNLTPAHVALAKENARAMEEAALHQSETVRQEVKETNALKNLKNGFEEFGKGATNLFNRVKRIASTMLIRSAIKGMIKAIKEGTSNLYEWSKQNNQAFSSAVDTIKAKTLEVKNSVGAAIAPAIAAAIPVINDLASAAITAFNAVNQLLALLSGGGSWTKATQGANNFAEAAKGAGGAASEWLAKFDELNVMNSSGGGGGGGSAIDYSNMFEEVTEFDQGIRDLVKFINDNMESIKTSAAAVGVAIAAWKLGEAFAESLPLLSTIFGYVATGATIAVTLQLNWMLMDEYLETGDEGWLFAAALTTAVGSTAAWAIAKTLIGGAAGAYAASITLTLSAITDIIALLGATDVSALSEECILTAIKASIEAGAAAGIMLATVGEATGLVTLQGASGVALITFGATIGLKTVLDPNVKLFSYDDIKGTIIASLAIGAGTFILTGMNLTKASGAALITFGVLIGLKTVLDDDVQLFSWDTLKGAITAALAVGAGTWLLTGGNIAKASGAALITFGALIGLKTVFDDSIEFASLESITGIVTGAFAIGAGTYLLTGGNLTKAGGIALIAFGALVGLKIVFDKNATLDKTSTIAGIITSAFTVGLGGYILSGGNLVLASGLAIFTASVLIGIKLITNANNIDDSGIHLTDEEVEKYVENDMFTVPVRTTLKLIADKIDISESERTNIEKATTEAIGELNVIKLGLATTDTYSSLEKDLENLVSATERYIKTAKDEGKFTLEFTPSLAGDTELEQGEWFTNYNLGWDKVNEFVQSKGKEIGELIIKGEKGEITSSESEILTALMTQLTNVTNAISKAGINSEAFAGLKISLGELDEASADKVIEKFKEYKQKLTDEYTKLVNDQYQKQSELVAALFEIDPNSAEYEKAKKDLEEMGKNLGKAVEDGVKSASASGENLILEWIFGKHAKGSIDKAGVAGAVSKYMKDNGIDAEGIQNAVYDVLKQGGVNATEIEAMKLINFTGWELMSDELQKKFISYVGVKPETIAAFKAIDVPASDLIKFVKWNELSSKEAEEMKAAFVNTFGPEGISALKSVIPNISATSIVSVVNWDNLAGEAFSNMVTALVKEFGEDGIAAIKSKLPKLSAKDLIGSIDWSGFTDKERKEFEAAIKKIFGGDEPKTTAKNAGSKLGEKVGEGMDSNLKEQKHNINVDAKLKDSAPKDINKEVSGIKPTVKAILQAPQKQKDGLKKDITKTIKPDIFTKPVASESAKTNVKTDIQNGVKPNVAVTPLVNSGILNKNVTQKIEGVNPEVTVTPKLSDTTSLKNAFKNAFTASLTMRSGGSSIGTISVSAAAEGGMFNSADLFVANENGVPELIGKVGNQTGVANTEQMVEAMARGVRGANEEQNNLLRQQNNLLARIANKEFKIGASSSLGRVAMQSIDMYSSAMGV